MRRPDLPRWGVVQIAAALGLLALAPGAGAVTRCVNVSHDGCIAEPSAALAFAHAVDGDRIELGPLTAGMALADAGRTLDVVGAGEGATVLAGGLTLSAAGSRVAGATLGGLDLGGGTAAHVRVTAAVRLHGTAALIASAVTGTGGVEAVDGAPRLESVVVDLAGGPGLRVACDATLRARHVTLAGSPAAAVTAACPPPRSRADLRDSILAVPGTVFTAPAGVTTSHSDYPAVAGRPDGAGDRHDAPAFAAGLRLPGGSPLLDAGTPEPLADSEWPEDRDGLPRAADGDGDGVARRDMGAFELPPPAVGPAAGNLLRDPGAEDGGGWELSGSFTRERYGAFPFPSAATGAALGAGAAFFAGGPGPSGAAEQVVDVTDLAPEIDLGRASAAVSGLLGGFRADGDASTLAAGFRDPAGASLGSVALTGPGATERANATTLLPRRRTDAVPPLTRSIAVSMRATRTTGTYDDGYFDGVGLVVSAPGAPPLGAAGAADHARRPFAGVRVLTGLATLDRAGRIAVRVACVSSTVGRCAGAITLTAKLRKGARADRVARAAVSLPPGATRRVRLRLRQVAGRAVRSRKRVRMTLFTAVRDGQGVARASTVPVTVTAPARERGPRR